MPVLVVAEGDKSVGQQLLTVLSKSTQNILHPTSWKGLTNPLLQAAGVRSFDTFAKSAKSVDVCVDDKGMLFTPTKNGGPPEGVLAPK
jgi:hypothetical protein